MSRDITALIDLLPVVHIHKLLTWYYGTTFS